MAGKDDETIRGSYEDDREAPFGALTRMRCEHAPALRRLASIVLPTSLVAFGLSLFLRSRLPDPSAVLGSLFQEPLQTSEAVPEPFEVTRKGVTYVVTPLYGYELWGMVVSYHHASSFVDISHREWKDFINVKDICVIWGKNVETGVYRRMRFFSRDFTCYYRYPDRETGQSFSESAFANNHLLPADLFVEEAILKARKGDQVHMKGWLVSYGHKGAPYQRKSSVVRTDRGNGACEVVYVTEFEVLRKANPFWRSVHRLSLILAGLALAALVFL